MYLDHNWKDSGSQLKTPFFEHENTGIIDTCTWRERERERGGEREEERERGGERERERERGRERGGEREGGKREREGEREGGEKERD